MENTTNPASYKHAPIEAAIRFVASCVVSYGFNSLLMCKGCRAWWYPKALDTPWCPSTQCVDNTKVIYVFGNGETANAYDGVSKPVPVSHKKKD